MDRVINRRPGCPFLAVYDWVRGGSGDGTYGPPVSPKPVATDDMKFSLDDRVTFSDFFFLPNAEKRARELTPAWTDADFRALPSWMYTIQGEAEDLLVVMTSESRLLTWAMNPNATSPVAVGLNQMTRTAFQSIGMLPADDDKAKAQFAALARKVAKMGVKEQFEQILIPYFAECARAAKMPLPWSAAKFYLANAAPSKLSLANNPDNVIYPAGTDEYLANRGLDVNGDGKVTVEDLENAVKWHQTTPEFVAAKYRYRKLNKLVPFVNPSLPST